MNIDFENQLVIVTGASRGIGQKIALDFAKSKAKVACIATSLDNLSHTLKQINEFGGTARGYACKIEDRKEVENTYEKIFSDFGIVPSILVNNAGITRDALIMRMKSEQWNEVLDVNLTGPFNWIQVLNKPMMSTRYGRIINISSIVGLCGGAGQANYAASKAGLIGLSKSVAKELGKKGITCNVVAPGYIDTEMTKILDDSIKQNVLQGCIVKRLGEVEDISPIVLFLASQYAGYITGQVILVDGGLSV